MEQIKVREEIAQIIAKQIPGFYTLMEVIIEKADFN
jgi:hypothetical protein